jgi:hypothetical protein
MTATTSIAVKDRERKAMVWNVPRGFGVQYRAVAREVAMGRYKGTRDLLGLVGYDVSAEVVATWSMREHVEAIVYALNVHARASDNPLRKHPRPAWLPQPWQGHERAATVLERHR